MYKIAVLGERESVLGFAAIGLETFPVDSPEAAKEQLKSLLEIDEEYAVFYITEGLYGQLETLIEGYSGRRLPAIIPIPGLSGNTGKGMLDIRKMVIKAVGSDVAFENE